MKSLIERRKYVVLIFLTLFVFLGTFLIGFCEAEARTVKLFYFLPNDRTYRQSVVDYMKTGILSAQSFYADQMEGHGHGRMTFSIETDGNGDPIVHRVDGAHPASHYESTGRPEGEIINAFDTSSIIQLVVMDINKSGGNGVGTKQKGRAVVNGTWNWSTAVHELGHAFGLLHDFRDDSYVMSYGDSRSALSAGAAQFLSVHPYFNSSIPLESGSAPSVELLSPTDYMYGTVEHVPVQLRVRDPDGIQQVTLSVKTPERGDPTVPSGFLEVIEYRNLSGETDVTVTFDYDGNTPSYGDTDLLNTLRHTISVSAVDSQGNRIDHVSSWTLQATDIPKLNVPLSERSPRVAEYIYNHIRNFHDRSVASYDNITKGHLDNITNIDIRNIHASDSPLQANDFDGLTNASRITLFFASGYSESTLLPAGIFNGLTSLSTVQMGYHHDSYGDDPKLYPILPFTVGLVKVGEGQFKAVVHTGAPYDMDLPLNVVNGSITGGTTSVTIPAGSVESDVLTVTRTPGTTAAVVVDLERTVANPGTGYYFYKSSYLLEMFGSLDGAPTPVTERTPQIIEAIVGEVPRIDYAHHNIDLRYMINGKFVDKKYNAANYVSEAHLAAITSLNAVGGTGTTFDSVFGGLAGNWFRQLGDITALKLGDFDGMTNLESLYLSGNKLSALPNSIIDTLTNLETLDLSSNELSSLPTGVFDKLTNLTGLSLFNNDFSSLTTGIFNKLTTLDTLNLSSNQLSTLPSGIFDKLTNLTYINLLDNPLSTLPSGIFDKLTNLETLFLPKNITPPSLPGVNTITPVADRTALVRDAIVAEAGVNSAADVTAAHLAAITELELGGGDLDDNGSITLYDNSLTGLKSGDFDNLTNLESLGIAGNFSSLPDGIFDNLVNLKGLGIVNTQMGSLPDGIFNNLVNLNVLTIVCTQLTSLPDGIFDNFTNLIYLAISFTQLSSLPDSIFDNFTNVPFMVLRNNQLSSLPDGIFDKATMTLDLSNNQLSSLPKGIFKGIFDTPPDLTGFDIFGFPAGPVPEDRLAELGEYTTILLTGNAVDPLPLTVSLEEVGNGQFKAVAPAGAPFELVLPITVANGTITGNPTNITIPVGGVESETFTVTRTAGTTLAVSVDIETLPTLWSNHSGYALVKSPDLPLVFTEYGGVLSVSARTPAVRDVIVDEVGVKSAADVTEAHLAAITSIGFALRNSVKVGDFDGLTGLTELSLATLLTSIPAGLFKDLNNVTTLEWDARLLNTLPTGVFDGLTNLNTLILSAQWLSSLPIGFFNNLTNLTYVDIYGADTLPLTVSLEKIADGQFKAVAPAGAPFDIVLPLTVTNGSISGGATTVTIPIGSLESDTLTVTRTAGTTAAVTIDIGALPNLPQDHDGYEIQKSTVLLLEVMSVRANSVPVITDGTNTTRFIAENTTSGQNIGNPIAATDADSGDTLTYTLGGTDASSFSIVSTSGQLQTKAALDYETNAFYAVTVTVSDGYGGSDSITVTINVTDVHEIPIIPVSDRTPEVRDAIVAAVPNVSDATNVTAEHIAAITSLNLRNAGITTLEADDFSGMTALTSINLFNNQLSSLPDGIFEGLTSLTTIRLGKNAVDPIPFTVSLEKVADGQFKAVAPAGALFNIVLPITVTDGSVTGGATTVTIPHGNVESDTLTVTRTAGTTADVTVDIGTLPSLPSTHFGYALVKSDVLPLPVIMGINTAPVFTDGTSTTRSIAENTDTGQHIGTAVAATDAENDTLTYTLSGNDASAFNIDDATGQLKTKSALDYETKSSYTVTITVSDGTLSETIKVTINVTDIDEVVTPPVTPDPPTANVAPEFLEGDSATRFVLENTAAHEDIGNVFVATDANNDTLAYTLGGVDGDSFDLDSSGQLKTKAALDYETKRVYTVTITVADEELSNTITVIISVIDVNDTVISAGFVPVADRTPEVRDAIVAAVPNVTDAVNVTESQVAAITSLNLRGKGIEKLKTGDFSGMTALTNLNLFKNNLSSLPSGLFTGLTALTTLRLGSNAVDPMPLIVSLQQVGAGQFQAIIPTGAPFNIVLPMSVTNGSINGGTTSTTIPIGSMESRTFTVSGTSVKVAFGTLPSLPENHFGYTLALSNVCNRTKAVAEAIANAVGASDCSAVTEVDLATITTLSLSNQSIASLAVGDFDGLFSLKTLSLSNNDLTSLPSGIFDDLVSLGELSLVSNKLTTLPSGVFSNLTSLTNLNLSSNDFSSLPSDAFEGLSSLSSINLQDNGLTSLPGSIFDGMSYLRSILLSNNNLTSIPNGIFEGLTQLNQLHLSWNPTSNSEMSLTVTLQKLGTNQFKVVAPSGAPFEMTLPIKVTNGTLAGGANAIMISKGSVESSPITVTRTPGTVTAVTADFGTPLPTLPDLHYGYVLVKSATLPLEVLPPLNLPPVFKDGANTVRAIAENSAAGTNIGDAVTATDQDANDTLTYSLGGTDAASFTIDNTTGQIKTKAALDYETKNSYVVTLTVSDGLATDTIVVTINITDIDENRAPVFTEGSSTTRTVSENTATGEHIGASVGATDADNDTLTYGLSGTDASAFGIDTSTGQLKTSASLDYETKRIYSVTITVSDDKLTDTIVVTINVTDVEEVETPPEEVDEVPSNNAPVFTDGSSTTRNVSEDAEIGVDIGASVGATDADGHTLTYILGGTDAATFSIDSTTGQLRTNTALDYETKSSYTVTITASDDTDEATITVTINVVDATENSAPVFIAGVSVSRSVAENTGSGVDIGTPIAANDVDGDTLTYTLGGPDASSFGIDSNNGQLRTDAFLDYETKSTYSVTITVSDGTLTDSISVTIIVTDVDETPTNSEPVFTDGSSTTRSIAENTDSGIDIGSAVSATDADDDILSYSLSGTDAASFSIDSSSGQLRTSSSLDYETTASYVVTVNVSDGQGGINSINVTISVTDVNDAPVFTAGSSTTRTVAESAAVNTNIGTAVSATDEDANTLTYTLSGIDAASFSIVSTSGQLQTQAALDYEIKASYSVIITASDGNLTDTITVTINVTSVNEAPTFTDGAATTRQIAENVGANINIGSAITATDPDGDTLTYTLGGTDAASFDIDSTNGQLKTKAALDFEKKTTYTVTISVADGNGGTDAINVTVNVTDLDETPSNNPPIFTEGNTATRSIAENTAANTNIGSPVAATDADENTLAYQLSGTDAASFSIDSNTGQLQTSTALDYETKTSYSVTITVTDGSSTDTITVTINVTDVNDAPKFTDGANTTRSIAENTAASSNIGTAVAATDEDGDTLSYTLGGTDAASFSIVGTSGQLQTNAALNYEVKSSYAVTISVTDSNGGNATINVTINVTDANDAPIFTDGNSTTRSIAENIASGADIGTAVAATDADTENTLTYTLGGTDAASFSIVSTSGQLQTSAALDYETKTSYSVTITVSDGSLTDTITVTINVTDAQENRAPTFTDGDSTTLSVAENTVSGQSIGTAVAATDPDNDTLTYTLGGTDAASFSIVSTSGQLRTKAALDYETKTSYSVKITVSDSKLTDSIDVTINVTDVLENRAPSFSDGSSTTRSVPENTASGQDIGTVVAATDPDNDTLSYTLGGTDSASFSINGTTGQLRTSASLNYESKSSYAVTVSVSDGNGESDSIDVTVNVTNVNEAPSFTDGSTTTRSIAENTASDTNIGSTVSATDVDSGTTLNYTLSGTDAASFSIVSTSGQLQTSAALDYETKTSYSVTITVSDSSLTDSITVTINVTDVAENSAPAFSAGVSISDISATAGTAITSVTLPAATDADDDTITYTLTPALPAGLTFTASTRELSGTPTTATASATYTYKASDGTLSASLTFTIQVSAPANNAPTFGTATISNISATKGTTITSVTLPEATDADDDTITYTLTPALPAGLTFTASTRILSGTPTAETASATYTYTASDGTLSDTLTFAIVVNAAAPDPPVNQRTQQVQDAIVAAIEGVDSADDVTAAHLAAITVLDLSSKSITSLKAGDFDGLTALTRLNLYNNSISDISALDDLTKLTWLTLSSNSISDISALEDLTKLTRLELSSNSISDISALEDLTMTYLDLENNSISDISALEDLTSLTSLTLNGNSISDISALEDLTKLTSLTLYTNSISDISALEDLTKLTDLNLSFNTISDISALEDLTELTILYLGNNSISDISALDGLTALTGLYLYNNSISDISALEDLTSLTSLTLNGNSISDISALEDLTKLTILHLHGNSISDISALEDLTKLTSLSLYNNSISDISALEDLTKLTRLELRRNPILDYGPLSRLKTANPSMVIDINLNNNLPVFSDGDSTTRSVAENTATGTNIGTAVAATDADNHTLTYSLGGADAESFSIVSTSGQLQTKAALDYETKSSYTVTVTAYDGNSGADRITVTINVTTEGANNAPVFTDGTSTTRSIAENTASSQNIGTAVAATDVDSGDTLTYTLGGTDAASFDIVSTSGQLQTKAALDYETDTSYEVTVSVSDGNGGSDSIDVTINVTDTDEAGNDPPTFTDGSSTTRSIAENTTSGTNIGDAVAATDSDSGDTLTYSLGGTDASSFSIVSTSGQLQTNAALDYETKTSYSVTVSVSDGNGGSDSISVTINVTDVNETDLSNAITFSYKDSTASRIGNTNIFNVTITGTITASQSVRVVGTIEGYVNDDSIGTAGVNETIDAGDSVDVSVSGIWEHDGSTSPTASIELDGTTITGLAPSAQPIPSETTLLANFPNPFNPETWIPYQLAKPTDVTLTIYNMRGVVVRQLKLGHKPAGVYTSRSRAIHWDGRNSIGEKVATGVYFYTLKAGDWTATRKMLIRK